MNGLRAEWEVEIIKLKQQIDQLTNKVVINQQ